LAAQYAFGKEFPSLFAIARKAAPGDKKMKQGNETVLLVDDDQAILCVGVEILERLGYRMFSASEGNEAIEVYRANRDIIDIIILDMVMPGMDGEETFRALKSINSNVAVVLSSGYSIQGKAMEIMKEGADDFIQKPFSMTQLSDKIRDVMDSREVEGKKDKGIRG
jgi:DNA-binding NtrC family response regulator